MGYSDAKWGIAMVGLRLTSRSENSPFCPVAGWDDPASNFVLVELNHGQAQMATVIPPLTIKMRRKGCKSNRNQNAGSKFYCSYRGFFSFSHSSHHEMDRQC